MYTYAPKIAVDFFSGVCALNHRPLFSYDPPHHNSLRELTLVKALVIPSVNAYAGSLIPAL